jgi:hypothetical protein
MTAVYLSKTRLIRVLELDCKNPTKSARKENVNIVQIVPNINSKKD